MTTFGVRCLQGPIPSVSESPIRRPWGLGFHVFYTGASHHCSVPGLYPCWVSCRHLAPCRASLHRMANGTRALSTETSLSPSPPSPPPPQFSAVQFHSHVRLFATPWSVAHQASLSITQLQGLAQTHVHRVSDSIQPSHPLLSPSPPAFNFSQHQGLSNESVLRIRWSKYWRFSFSICPSNEYSGLISFRMDWFDLLAVQGTLKSLL